MPQLAASASALLISASRRFETVEHAVAHLATCPPGPEGTIRVEIDVDGAVEGWTVDFRATSVELAPSVDPQAVVRVTLSDLMEVVEGQADGALLYLGERLTVTGDEALVLALGSALRAPGADRTVIDAAALDPVAVSDAIGAASSAHLAQVMCGGFRELVLTEVFRRLPEFLVEEKAHRVKVAVMFEIERGASDDVDRYVVRVADGMCSVEPRAGAETPVDATIVLAGEEFLRLTLGHLNPVRGVLSGQIRVRGQVIKVLGFNSVMNIPGS